MYRHSAAAVVAALLSCGSAFAQGQQIEWKQTLSTPKGLNLPKDVKGDILDIELGDTYAEVKPKLQKLLTDPANTEKQKASGDDAIGEMMGERSGGPLEERLTQFRFAVPGGHVTASYVGRVVLIRKMKVGTQQTIHDALDIKMSAPSSGQQVLGIKRSLIYPQSDQPRVSELLTAVKQKFGAEAQRVDEYTYRFIFDNGRSYVPAKVDLANGCRPQHDMQGQLQDIVALAKSRRRLRRGA